MTERSRAKAGGRKKAAKKSAEASDETPNPFASLSFEDALARLEGIVDRLEEGEIDLAEALTGFEEGVQLTKHCQGQLEAAEQRVELLTRDGGEWATRPFASDASAAARQDEEDEDAG